MVICMASLISLFWAAQCRRTYPLSALLCFGFVWNWFKTVNYRTDGQPELLGSPIDVLGQHGATVDIVW